MSDAPALPPCSHRPKPYAGPTYDETLALRKQYLNPGLFLYYRKPLMVVEGHLQYVWDETGRRYLDAIGGIVTVSVGHCHPAVVQAGSDQLGTIGHTTTLYLNHVICEYAEALAAKMPGELKCVYFVNSGSEANDLAMLMARLYTGNYDLIALRNGYHGGIASTMALTAHSTWKFNVPQTFGVHHAMAPDPYRGPWGRNDPDAGRKYAADVQDVIRFATPGKVAGFFAESVQGVGGFVVFPDGYLQEAYRIVRAAGGVCIADEVQTGFGRLGSHYWGFEAQGVVPDIVTMAKSIGNGAPLAAVVTTPKIAATLTQRIHFNTFGGNPVSCAIGHAVLKTIDREHLQQACAERGVQLSQGLERLKAKFPIIGDVRGSGLMQAIELVRDRATKEPAKEEAILFMERMKDLGVLLGKGGLSGNVIRITPPMCISAADVQFLLAAMELALPVA